MAEKLSEISRVIGGLEKAVGGLEKTMTQHCIDDDRRHEENITALRTMSAILTPLAQTVADMKPIVQSYQASRLKMIGALGLAATLLGLFGSLIQAAIMRVFGGPH
jgi:hypothetical protein